MIATTPPTTRCICRLIHSPDSKKAGTETESKRLAIEKITTKLMAVLAIQHGMSSELGEKGNPL